MGTFVWFDFTGREYLPRLSYLPRLVPVRRNTLLREAPNAPRLVTLESWRTHLRGYNVTIERLTHPASP